jgi:uncharacterized protein (TIRG00374 family)
MESLTNRSIFSPFLQERLQGGSWGEVKFKGFLKYGLHVMVLGGLIVAAVKYVDGESFMQAVRQFDWRYVPIICALGLASVLIKGWRFGTMVRKVAEVDRPTLLKAYVAGQSATLVPGGIAARAGLLDQVGVPASKTGAAITLSSMSDQFLFLLLTLVCAAWFEEARRPVLILIGILTVLAVLLGIQAVRVWLFRLVKAILGRFKLDVAFSRFIIATKETATPKILLYGIANTAMAFACLILALHLCLMGVGASVPLMTLLLAFSLPTMLGRISALPGGVGVTEFGMTGILNAAPGVSMGEAAAAVTIFRLATVLFTAIAGGLVYFTLWRSVPKEATA